MKNLLFLSGIILALLLGSCATNPTDYSTAIVNQVSSVITEKDNLLTLLQEQKFDEVQAALDRGKKRTQSALRKLQRMSAFRGDDGLRLAAIDFVSFYDRLFSNEEILKVADFAKRGEKFSIDENERLFQVLSNIFEEENAVTIKLVNEHNAFIQKYGLLRFDYFQPR